MKLKTILLLATAIVGTCLTSCNNKANPTSNKQEVKLDALTDGTIVVLYYQLNDEEFYIPFVRVGDTYQLLEDYWLTRAGEGEDSQKYDITLVHDKSKSYITFYVKEKATGNLVLTAVYDIKSSTLEATAGNKTYKITNVKLDVFGKSDTTLAAALVKGSKVVISVKFYGKTTVFTFINDGNFACSITGNDVDDFQGSSLKLDGSTLKFHAVNWNDPDCELEIHFFPEKNTWKFWTVHNAAYDSHTISVNGTDITTKLKKE